MRVIFRKDNKKIVKIVEEINYIIFYDNQIFDEAKIESMEIPIDYFNYRFVNGTIVRI